MVYITLSGIIYNTQYEIHVNVLSWTIYNCIACIVRKILDYS